MARSPAGESAVRTMARPGAFRLGVAIVLAGTLLHLPDVFMSGHHDFMMSHMPMSATMVLGMVLIGVGTVLAGYALVPRRSTAPALPPLRIVPSDRDRLTPAHAGLLAVLLFAVVIDVAKPATLGLVLPGLREEYGISADQAALLPLVALTGTVVGSLAWGVAADRIGRRPSILLAAVLFTATAVCGAMPSFTWNLITCFAMGSAAGGMVPTLFALLAESIPSRLRGRWSVLLASLGASGGYLLATGMAAALEAVSWRFLWLSGLPTGLLLVALNRYIPESPRFLLARGDAAGAEAVMRTYDMRTEPMAASADPPGTGAGGLRELVQHRPYALRFVMVAVLSLSWGLVNYGFLTMLPTMLDSAVQVDFAKLLFVASLCALLISFAVAFAYERLGSRRSLMIYAGGSAVALVTMSLVPASVQATSPLLLGLQIVVVLITCSGLSAMLGPYTAEVFPTALRGSAGGLGAAFGKAGGVVGPPVVAVVAASGGMGLAALAVAVPLGACVAMVAARGIETSGIALEDLAAATSAPAGSRV
ncbi:MFS transporter [Blastococcus sp. KM273128]|uniref:MFS transporter n=1 Tax=Blastococcus sp. KM273128 TaxID=2570314 RepID=UPI001F00B6AF|nr:MFS transporter [Blastococcus sp. KM273128]MCF6744047.1 MFS transporter [Blastococcus sp. KM273128]